MKAKKVFREYVFQGQGDRSAVVQLIRTDDEVLNHAYEIIEAADSIDETEVAGRVEALLDEALQPAAALAAVPNKVVSLVDAPQKKWRYRPWLQAAAALVVVGATGWVARYWWAPQPSVSVATVRAMNNLLVDEANGSAFVGRRWSLRSGMAVGLYADLQQLDLAVLGPPERAYLEDLITAGVGEFDKAAPAQQVCAGGPQESERQACRLGVWVYTVLRDDAEGHLTPARFKQPEAQGVLDWVESAPWGELKPQVAQLRAARAPDAAVQAQWVDLLKNIALR